jgi:hypothetical protein
MTVSDGFDDKGEQPAMLPASKTLPQHEVDAQATREKMARLRAMRLAQEAANPTGRKPATTAAKRTGAKKSASKAGEKSVSLSDWLTAQQKEGRRN